MHSFTTPGPAALTVRFAAGSLVVRTGDDPGDSESSTTTVDVRPHNPADTAAIDLAAATTVEQRGNDIVVVVPHGQGWLRRRPAIDIEAVVPRHSDVTADVKSASVQLTGELGRVRVESASGEVRVEEAAELSTRSASGDVQCGRIGGTASVTTASGDIRLGVLGGSADLGSASGDIAVESVARDCNVRTASGDVSVGIADASVAARTASGDVRIGSVRTGTVEVDSASGDVSVGVAAGTSAWLDVHSHSGDTISLLDPTDAPGPEARTVSIHARTHSGDVTIRRASA